VNNCADVALRAALTVLQSWIQCTYYLHNENTSGEMVSHCQQINERSRSLSFSLFIFFT
jgi:hypothetical protein